MRPTRCYQQHSNLTNVVRRCRRWPPLWVERELGPIGTVKMGATPCWLFSVHHQIHHHEQSIDPTILPLALTQSTPHVVSMFASRTRSQSVQLLRVVSDECPSRSIILESSDTVSDASIILRLWNAAQDRLPYPRGGATNAALEL